MPAQVNIDPSISLKLNQSNPVANLGQTIQTAAGMQDFVKARELLPYAIEAGKAQSELNKYQAETAGYSTAKAKQENTERIAKQDFFANPDNWQTNGRIDINKVNKFLPAIAPLTHRDDLEKLTTLGEAQTKGIEAKTKMDTGFRTIVGNTLGILGRSGVKDVETYRSALQNLKSEYKDNKDVTDYIDSRLDILKYVPKNADISKEALRESQSLLSPQEQQTTFAPNVSFVNTGSAIQPTTVQQAPSGEPVQINKAGNAIPLTLNPGQRAVPTGRTDTNNNPTQYILDDRGNIVGETVISAGVPENSTRPQIRSAPATSAAAPNKAAAPAAAVPAAPVAPSNAPARLRKGETPETRKAADDLRLKTQDAAATVPNQQFNNNQIIKLADQVTTGSGAQLIANLGGGYAAIPWSTDGASNLSQLGHYMALQTAQLAQSSGLGGTDASRGIAGQISGTTEWTADAIKKTARVNRAFATATGLLNQGMDNAFNKNSDPFAARDFQNKWSKVADINAIRLYDSIKNEDKDGIREVVDSLGGPGSKGYKKALDSIRFMNTLIKGK
jgi:hypothetical protein